MKIRKLLKNFKGSDKECLRLGRAVVKGLKAVRNKEDFFDWHFWNENVELDGYIHLEFFWDRLTLKKMLQLKTFLSDNKEYHPVFMPGTHDNFWKRDGEGVGSSQIMLTMMIPTQTDKA